MTYHQRLLATQLAHNFAMMAIPVHVTEDAHINAIYAPLYAVRLSVHVCSPSYWLIKSAIWGSAR